jgi:predicted nucleic acid-binding protein
MPDKVVDASVLVAIAFGEPRAFEAQGMLEGTTLYAPDLLLYELCSAALTKARRHPEQALGIVAGLSLALTMNVNLRPVPTAELFLLAMESGLSAYDAAYLWLKRNLSCPLVTFDEQLARIAALV